MVRETVEYTDGSAVEVEINRLGFRTANKIARKHIPINSLTFNKGSDDITINGDVDLFGMAESCLETVTGLDLDKISSDEANRLYKKHFQKDVMAGLGGAGNPN